MSRPETSTIEGVTFVGPEEAAKMFDQMAQQLVAMSGEEFLRRWDAGEFHDKFDMPGNQDLTWLVMHLSLVRPQD